MPLKIILGQGLKTVSGNQQTLLNKSYLLSFNNFIFSHGDESAGTMTDASKKTLKNDLNKWFLQTYDKMKDRFLMMIFMMFPIIIGQEIRLHPVRLIA